MCEPCEWKFVDVSKYQGNIDWEKVADTGIDGAIVRCGYRGWGSGKICADEKAEANAVGSERLLLHNGVYFFSQAVTEAEAVAEAEFCLDFIERTDITCGAGVWIDSEWSHNEHTGRADNLTVKARTAVVKAFCDRIRKAGYKTGVYASTSWLRSMLNMSELTGIGVWCAQWGDECTWRDWEVTGWQYSNNGSVAGISGRVDLSVWYDDFMDEEIEAANREYADLMEALENESLRSQFLYKAFTGLFDAIDGVLDEYRGMRGTCDDD